MHALWRRYVSVKKTELLIHVGSIAALYLGDSSEVITGRTPVDPQPHKRAPYARAKAMADQLLMDWHQERGLPVCILRPGIVVGEGASPFHSGLGFFNNEQHCMGWNQGRNPLPFVLVEDVADAIARAALRPELSGRSLNLVGDVAMTAREYIDELALAIGRPLRFHGQLPEKLYLVEWGKWGVKRLAGRKDALPSYRDLRSRGCLATFDCSDAKAALDWAPVSEREVFIDKAIRVQAHTSRESHCAEWHDPRYETLRRHSPRQLFWPTRQRATFEDVIATIDLDGLFRLRKTAGQSSKTLNAIKYFNLHGYMHEQMKRALSLGLNNSAKSGVGYRYWFWLLSVYLRIFW